MLILIATLDYGFPFMLDIPMKETIDFYIQGFDFSEGDTCVTVASRKGHAEIVKLFVEAGADLDHPYDRGATGLFVACENGDVKTAQVLVDGGAMRAPVPRFRLSKRNIKCNLNLIK